MDVIHQIWPNWTTVNEIGEGAFGKVYKVKREDLGNVSYSAVKVMHIPKDNSEINDLYHSGWILIQYTPTLRIWCKIF